MIPTNMWLGTKSSYCDSEDMRTFFDMQRKSLRKVTDSVTELYGELDESILSCMAAGVPISDIMIIKPELKTDETGKCEVNARFGFTAEAWKRCYGLTTP